MTSKVACSQGTTRRTLGYFAGTLAIAFAVAAPALAEKNEAPATGANVVVARVLPPAEKIKVLEDELAKEMDRRIKLEEELPRRVAENGELLASAKTAQRERAELEAKLVTARERELQLQRTNDRLREETERVTVSVRFALPVIAGIAIMILAMIVWTLLFLRQVAARVHGQRTLMEMHELEGRLVRTTDLLNAELKRTQALKHKLAEFGASD
jgi:hypothetical protein